MENKVSQSRKYYLSEFDLFDGDHYITFNIVDINTDKNNITVAISSEGKISVCTFDLKSEADCLSDGKRLYFEYGLYCEKIAVEDFEQINDEEDSD